MIQMPQLSLGKPEKIGKQIETFSKIMKFAVCFPSMDNSLSVGNETVIYFENG